MSFIGICACIHNTLKHPSYSAIGVSCFEGDFNLKKAHRYLTNVIALIWRSLRACSPKRRHRRVRAASQEGDTDALLDTDRNLSGLIECGGLPESGQFAVRNGYRRIEYIGNRPKTGSKERGQLNRFASPALTQKLCRCHARARDVQSLPLGPQNVC
jgi:hypothetical protein